ncbi:hypothetical protein B0H10DRAFT_746150 [Mycena sp. CBHHK59/15]|nr:hypothetical protein B0H10DRAFT_746150 [Mycena sp. CBHHK59/15]
MRMNGWLRAIPCRHCLLAQSWAHWPNFPLSRRASSQVAASRTPLSDLLATAPLAAAATPPLVRRILLLTHLPLACTPARLLDAVHTGSLEALALDAPARTARLAFLEGRGAAAFCAALHGLRANTGADSDSSLDVFVSTTLAWLPYRPLHPVVAAAVAQDGARRCIVLSRPYMGSASVSVPSSGSVSMSSSSFPLSAATDTPTGPWTPAALTHLLAHLGLGPIERVDVTPLEDAPLAPPADAATHSEVAIVHFLSIADAIKAHALLRAHPALLHVHVAYGTDRCEVSPSTSPFLSASPALFDSAPARDFVYFPPFPSNTTPSPPSPTADADVELPTDAKPTYIPAAHDTEFKRTPDAMVPMTPFTTLALRGVPRGTPLGAVCARVWGGPLAAVGLRRVEGVGAANATGGEGDETVEDTVHLTFLRPEDARDFYAGVLVRGLRVRGVRVAVRPVLSVPTPSSDYDCVGESSGHTYGSAGKYPPTRVLRVRVFGDGAGLTRRQLAADCAAFGAVLGVRVDPCVFAFCSFWFLADSGYSLYSPSISESRAFESHLPLPYHPSHLRMDVDSGPTFYLTHTACTYIF